MNETPSSRRREGREAFDPNAEPQDLCPYNPKNFNFHCRMKDFIDGWNEAGERYERLMK